ncbi:class I SAM-dependent methyltransferase [Candidatus Acetothermia bacterium]|nr:class I SAM-dependent methyltransferase [Candidatus Acetothermia bacterium]MBI3643581.1 class I SAM-dependent methyltransferase [Candidatus Acetothermia bacterium]
MPKQLLRRLIAIVKRPLAIFKSQKRIRKDGQEAARQDYDERISGLYEKKDYLDAYSDHTDLRVEEDPHEAIGGMWEEIGTLQYEFLLKKGLKPSHTLLDIGCGTLRAGRYFIKYLNPGGYTGLDISSKAIQYAKELVVTEGLTDKRPSLLHNPGKNLKFDDFHGEKFDYLLAHSVFTHLKPEHITECFEYAKRLMKPDSKFFFTFKEASRFSETGLKGFAYPFAFFAELAERFGYNLINVSHEYLHPKGQRMVLLSKQKISPGNMGDSSAGMA